MDFHFVSLMVTRVMVRVRGKSRDHHCSRWRIRKQPWSYTIDGEVTNSWSKIHLHNWRLCNSCPVVQLQNALIQKLLQLINSGTVESTQILTFSEHKTITCISG